MQGDAIAELVDAIEAGHPPPLAWIVRWSNGGEDPVRNAWANSRDPHAMLRLLAAVQPDSAVCTILQIAINALDELLAKLRASPVGYLEFGDTLWYLRYLHHLAGVGQLGHALGVLQRLPRCTGPERPERRTEFWLLVAGALRQVVREPPALDELLRARRAA